MTIFVVDTFSLCYDYLVVFLEFELQLMCSFQAV